MPFLTSTLGERRPHQLRLSLPCWSRSCPPAPNSTHGAADRSSAWLGSSFRHATARRADTVSSHVRGGQPPLLRAASRTGSPRAVVFIRRTGPAPGHRRSGAGGLQRAVPGGADAQPLRSHRHDGGEVRYGWTHGDADVRTRRSRDGSRQATRAGFGGGVHHRALLGLHAAARWQHAGIPGRAPAWHVWSASDSWLPGPLQISTGRISPQCSRAPPGSAFVAMGSAVAVHHGRRLEPRSDSMKVRRGSLTLRIRPQGG